jgi:hypothetical protein
MSEVIDITDFGGGPDETPEDNRAALDAAVSEASRRGGSCTVFIPTGTAVGPPAWRIENNRFTSSNPPT